MILIVFIVHGMAIAIGPVLLRDVAVMMLATGSEFCGTTGFLEPGSRNLVVNKHPAFKRNIWRI